LNNVIINKKKKPKIFPSHAWVTIVDFVYPVFALWFYCSQRRLNYLSSQSSDFECTWRRVFQKRVMRTKFDIFGIVLPTSVLFCYREVRPNNLSLVCLYLSLYISFLLFGHFFLTHWHRKHYYIKVVESIQFACAGNSGISRVLCNANTYRSIHEGLFFNSRPVLDLKYPLRLPYIHFYFSSLHLQYKINGIIHKYFNQSDWLLYFSGRRGECQTTRTVVKD
jgi:hypothetical protein